MLWLVVAGKTSLLVRWSRVVSQLRKSPAMRMPMSKIYRAFPELDRFNDEQCERFVEKANRWQDAVFQNILLGAFLFIGLFVIIPVVWITVHALVLVFIPDDLRYRYNASTLFMAIKLTVEFGGLFIGMLLMRDQLLLARIRKVLARSSHCIKCDYSLLGLPVSSHNTIKCPECGHVTIVDFSIKELAIDQDSGTLKSTL